MSKEDFIKSLDVTNNLRYRYSELLNRYKVKAKEIIEKQNSRSAQENSLIQYLSQMIRIFPDKSQLIQEAISMIYSDEYLSEYNYKKLYNVFEKIFC